MADPLTPDDASDAVARREYKFIERLVIVSLALSCALALSLNLVDPDLWGHVRYGQELLAERELPRTATHTFTAPDHPWINHENLAEIVLAVGYDYLGASGLLFAKCMWGMAILGLMVWVARRHGVSALAAWATMLLVANNLTAFFPMRPQLLSFMWFALLLVVVDRAFARWDQLRFDARWLWLAPPIVLLWTNSHGGFMAGLCVFGALLGGRSIELLVRGGLRRWPQVLHLAAIGVTALAATLINPYGIELHRWLANSLSRPRPEITEWAAPSPSDPVFIPLVALLTVAALALAGTRRRRDWTQIVILALVAWQSTCHLRHIAFLALLAGFWLPVHIQSALGRLRPVNRHALPTIRLAPWLRRTATLGLAVTIGLMSAGLFHRVRAFPVYLNKYPVDALQYVADKQLGGRLLVCFNWAQYAIAALAPDVEVAFDGRFRTCYPQEIVDMHFDFLLGEFDGRRYRSPRSGPVDGTKALDFGNPNLVLLDRTYDACVAHMQAAVEANPAEWVLLYQDRLAQLWGRRDLYDQPDLPTYIPESKRIVGDFESKAAVQWPALPVTRRSGSIAQNAPRDASANELSLVSSRYQTDTTLPEQTAR